MKKISMLFLYTILLFTFLIGCQSQREKEEEMARERLKKRIGDVDKGLEDWKKSQEKPVKPFWDR